MQRYLLIRFRGIKLANNFNFPYLATSIKDFWQKWHISLSSWLKDYIYIPLGGNRLGKARKYVNVMIVFFISGLWHGVGIKFLVWGLLHGVYQVVGDCLQPVRDTLVKALGIKREVFSHKLFKQIVTFNLVNFAWIFFRADKFTVAIKMIKSMFTVFNPEIFFDYSLYKMGLDARKFYVLIFGIVILLIVAILKNNCKISIRKAINEQNLLFRWTLYLVAVFAVIIFGVYGMGYNAQDFIYAQF